MQYACKLNKSIQLTKIIDGIWINRSSHGSQYAIWFLNKSLKAQADTI